MQRWIGRWLCVVGVLHVALGVAMFHAPLAGMLAEGLWATMGGNRERQLAFWFVSAGISLLLVGTLVDALEREGRALPRAFTWGLVGFAVSGAILIPRSGFWCVLVAALGSVARGRRARHLVATTDTISPGNGGLHAGA